MDQRLREKEQSARLAPQDAEAARSYLHALGRSGDEVADWLARLQAWRGGAEPLSADETRGVRHEPRTAVSKVDPDPRGGLRVVSTGPGWVVALRGESLVGLDSSDLSTRWSAPSLRHQGHAYTVADGSGPIVVHRDERDVVVRRATTGVEVARWAWPGDSTGSLRCHGDRIVITPSRLVTDIPLGEWVEPPRGGALHELNGCLLATKAVDRCELVPAGRRYLLHDREGVVRGVEQDLRTIAWEVPARLLSADAWGVLVERDADEAQGRVRPTTIQELDFANGAVRWSTRVQASLMGGVGPYGDRIVHMGWGDHETTVLWGLDRRTGELLWERELAGELGAAHGAGGVLYLALDPPASDPGPSRIEALDVLTGETVWARALEFPVMGLGRHFSLHALDASLLIVADHVTELWA